MPITGIGTDRWWTRLVIRLNHRRIGESPLRPSHATGAWSRRVNATPVLLSLAIGALLFQTRTPQWYSAEVDVVLGGDTHRVTLPTTPAERDALVKSWFATVPPPRDERWFAMQWRNEVAKVYASRLETEDERVDTNAASPFQLISASQRSAGEPTAKSEIWQSYWERQAVGTGEQLRLRGQLHREWLATTANRLLARGQAARGFPATAMAWVILASIASGALWWRTQRVIARASREHPIELVDVDGTRTPVPDSWFTLSTPVWYRLTLGLVWATIGLAAVAHLPN